MKVLTSPLSPMKMFLVIFTLGILTRSYGITDHWKNNDHYNFAGVSTTHALKCLKSTPFDISRGLYLSFCDTASPDLYENHSPAFLYPMWGLTLVFGEGEWVTRLSTLIHSALAILLVFLIGLQVWPLEPYRAVFASFFQAFFLGPMYFGTHIDPITEFTLTFMLLSTYAALRNKIFWSLFWALIAGFTAWIGFFHFASLLAFAWLRGKDFKKTLAGTFVGFLFCVALLMYLQGTWDILAFVQKKIFNPEYIPAEDWVEKALWPVRFVKNFFVSQARLLGPLFASFVFYELVFGRASKIFSYKKGVWSQATNYQWALLLLSLGSAIYSVLGVKYVMVHIYLFNFFMPLYALLATEFVWKVFQQGVQSIEPKKYALWALPLVALYPYGIYKTNVLHDAITSGLIVLLSGYMLWAIFKRRLSSQVLQFCLVAAALLNFSQVVNYRNEADTEFPFCEWARAEYARTGQPIRTKEPHTRNKEFLYCRGIPIIYE
ncbi:MAG: hypothetical protein AB7F59_01875 [Bdellovibrionales bacterium]